MTSEKIESIDQVQEALRQQLYIADRSLATSIYLALKLGKPLFLEGEAGVGKTEVAKVLASMLGRSLMSSGFGSPPTSMAPHPSMGRAKIPTPLQAAFALNSSLGRIPVSVKFLSCNSTATHNFGDKLSTPWISDIVSRMTYSSGIVSSCMSAE